MYIYYIRLGVTKLNDVIAAMKWKSLRVFQPRKDGLVRKTLTELLDDEFFQKT